MLESIDKSMGLPVPTVLLVEDEPQVRNAYARLLRECGMGVVELPDGRFVEETLATGMFDAVVSDIRMPGSNGLDVLKIVRQKDPDLPVLLVTAGGDVSSAVQAVEHGALRYLLKPIAPAALAAAVTDAVRRRRLANIQRHAFELFGSAAVNESRSADQVVRYERALETLTMVYQPIVKWSERRVFAYEALVRNGEPTLRAPDALFDCATSLGRLVELGRAIRRSVAETMATTGVHRLFVNLHPRDLDDDELLSGEAPLSKFAHRVVLEITERSTLGRVSDLKARLARLRQLGFKLAVDDLGAGYAGLNWFAQLEPEVVKLDMSLIRHIDTEPTKQRLVGSMLTLCRDLGILVVAEGIETAAERAALVSNGCDLLQGYLLARPGQAFPEPSFGDEPA